MGQRRINPWKWQDQLGFSQAIEVSGTSRTLYCAGQTAMDAQGRPAHVGDMAGQLAMALDNVEAVLKASGFGLGDVVRLNYYTTNIPAFFGAYETVTRRLSAAGCQPASTLLGVTSLAFPELLVEIEATAVN